MCTVTYIPGKNGYYLSSNRDESPQRAESHLVVEHLEKTRILFPRDTKGGSWLIVSDTGRAACLLNGAFKKHKHLPPYRLSRGIVLKDLFKVKDVSQFLRSYDLKGIEPFTMIVVDRLGLTEVRWDGKMKYARTLDPEQYYLWSSSTLYTPQMHKNRLDWLEDQLKTSELSLTQIKNIHRSGGKGNLEYGYIMNRENRVKTISISHIAKNDKEIIMEFENLVTPETQVRQMQLSPDVIQPES